MSEQESQEPIRISLRRGEWAALMIESIVLGGVVMAAVVTIGQRVAGLAESLSFGLGILAVGIVLLPVNRVLFRRIQPRPPSVVRLIAATVAGTAIGTVIHYLLLRA